MWSQMAGGDTEADGEQVSALGGPGSTGAELGGKAAATPSARTSG
jgi:hypothetical protein